MDFKIVELFKRKKCIKLMQIKVNSLALFFLFFLIFAFWANNLLNFFMVYNKIVYRKYFVNSNILIVYSIYWTELLINLIIYLFFLFHQVIAFVNQTKWRKYIIKKTIDYYFSTYLIFYYSITFQKILIYR